MRKTSNLKETLREVDYFSPNDETFEVEENITTDEIKNT